MLFEKYTVDRFEGELAVLLLRKDESIQKDVPRSQLPDQTKEGDILEVQFLDDGKIVQANILANETESAKKRADDLLQKILNKNNK